MTWLPSIICWLVALAVLRGVWLAVERAGYGDWADHAGWIVGAVALAGLGWAVMP